MIPQTQRIWVVTRIILLHIWGKIRQSRDRRERDHTAWGPGFSPIKVSLICI